ncbi:MAG: alpha/beta hydrolase family protein [Ferruginibacter sp.]
MKIKILLLSFLIAGNSFAGTVDTVSIFSNSMHKKIKAVVIKPSTYETNKEHYSVVYLLHGFSGDFSNWIKQVPELKKYADDFNILIVCPDGAYSSWYFDSPVDTSYRYETYIASEVISFIDKMYRTVADRQHRGITGLSMGGHGALFLALRHPDTFGAAGSMSGAVDLEECIGRFDVIYRIGDTLSHKKEWHDLSVLHIVEHATATPVKIMFDCGTQDIFIKGNRELHQKMLELNIPHDYIERAGMHNWDYWKNAVPYELLFFKKYFSKN